MVGKILTKELLIKERVENNAGYKTGLYHGKSTDPDALFDKENAIPIEKTVKVDVEGKAVNQKEECESFVSAESNKKWVDSSEYHKFWNKLEDTLKKVRNQVERKVNIAQFPDDYYDLIDMMRIDVTRRRIEEVDFTNRISTEIVNPAFSRSVRLDEFLPFTGAFTEIQGRGESVPLIQQKTGETGTEIMHIYGLGHERTLEDELYNTNIYSLQKVLNAVTRAHTGARNQLALGPMIQHSIDETWVLSQRVAASVDASYELALYHTIHNALRKLYALLDPQTLLEINAPRVALIVGSNVITWDLNRVLNGDLALSRSGITNNTSITNVSPLPIDEIWKYRGDTLYIGPDRVVYPGVPDNTAYLVVIADGQGSNANYTLTKRGLTQEVGRGDVLTLAREKRAWYFVQGRYNKEFYGETGGCAANTGFVVEISLPSFKENT